MSESESYLSFIKIALGESNEKNICNPEAKKWNKEMMSICRVILATVMNLQPKGIML